jgi:alpha-D-xyloside xylohydrolase
MRRLTLLLALAVLAAVVAACGGSSGSSQEPPRGLSVRIEESPFRLTLLRDGEPIVSQDPDARLRYELATSGEAYRITDVTSSRVNADGTGVYEVATDEPGRTATVTVAKSPASYRLSLRFHPETDVQEVFDSFGTTPDEHFLGAGQRGGRVDLAGQILQIKVGYKCTYVATPFFASSAGWGLRLATWRISALAFPGSPGGTGCQSGAYACTFPRLEARVDVCVLGARLDEDLYAGSIPRVLDAYESQAGRPRVPPPSQLELIKWRDEVSGPAEVLDDVRRFQAAGIPLGWVLVDNPWETCNGTLAFDRARFPNPAGLIRQTHDLGVRFMLWISPKITCGRYPSGARLGAVENQTLDFRRADVVRVYQARLRKLAKLGIDGIKADRADEVELETVSPTLQNLYPLLFGRATMSALPAGTAAIFRAGTMGSQSVAPGIWAGDQPGEFIGLQRAIRAGATAGMSGFHTWGSDIGGYSSDMLTEELFVRWAQLGAVSPVMEVGGRGPNRMPWMLGPRAMPALRDAAILHYELFPYIYDLLRRREPVLRPLGYAYQHDPEAWKADLELLVGPDLLAAPVVGPGTSPSVYLPSGTWVDLYSGRTVAGGSVFNRETPLEEFPLYARAGAVIPFNLRTRRNSWWGLNEQMHPGRAGFLATNGALLALRGQPRDVQVFVPASSPPRSVTIGGRRVSWTWNAGPLPGAVIRVRGPVVEGRVVLSGA